MIIKGKIERIAYFGEFGDSVAHYNFYVKGNKNLICINVDRFNRLCETYKCKQEDMIEEYVSYNTRTETFKTRGWNLIEEFRPYKELRKKLKTLTDAEFITAYRDKRKNEPVNNSNITTTEDWCKYQNEMVQFYNEQIDRKLEMKENAN